MFSFLRINMRNVKYICSFMVIFLMLEYCLNIHLDNKLEEEGSQILNC